MNYRSLHNPSEQLVLLENLCKRHSVILYKSQALYLQIIREELTATTRKALFCLTNQFNPSVFSSLKESKRKHFHFSVNSLIKKSISLLTVEQLMHLMTQMHHEKYQQRMRANQEMLEGISKHIEQSESVPTKQTESIQLNAASSPTEVADTNVENNSNQSVPKNLDVLRSLFSLASESLDKNDEEFISDHHNFDNFSSKETKHCFLPCMPDLLLAWMEGVELALYRNLRNLSYKINEQMLRAGLTNTLLPVNLLEAVLCGQIETQAAPSNVLKLNLPIAIGEIEEGMDVHCLLLRPNDLEFDSPRLRKCRKKLRQHYLDLIHMVKQQNHWQRRFLDKEASHHWTLFNEKKK